MKTVNSDITLVDSYFMMLNNLSANNKLELISRLSNSLKTRKKETDDGWMSLFGSMKLDEPVEEFVADLKKERNFKRKTVEL